MITQGTSIGVVKGDTRSLDNKVDRASIFKVKGCYCGPASRNP